ncbi:MAG: PIN domain-containing protein [Chloroflexi bacterium]|nr:PIN domain-containing protein [Chloroflexota bacterium]
MMKSDRVFIDSSVLIAAAISARGAARVLILCAFRREVDLQISDLVVEETGRNIARKVPTALPTFHLLRESLPVEVTNPPKTLVLRVAKSVTPKDAPIVAAALKAGAQYLATYDQRHLLSQKEAVKADFGIIVATPDEILKRLRLPTL